ncbi:putative disease resistance protein At3g14460 [Cajanus cajan]|uniref:putative disease resistance protein At3g14460 n=1 Tax=Cajanus cajan TaxID=3821 RepID=UPI0010FB9452|nr:putative disease resistance protein At3g14460 [Cajanus cajan]XP_029124746.1 putative disease resistance protein At3g14460 [Cajanus cajan]
MALVGEALLSAAVEVLLDRIVSHDLFRSKKPDTSLLEKLRITLLSVEALLNDAEEKQFTNPPVKKWLHALKQAFFDAEDLLDQINTEALRCKLEANSPTQSTTHQVLNFLSSPFNKFQKVINSKIQDLFQRLEHLALQKDILQLKEGVSSSVWHGTPTSSVVDESTISGRDGDRKELKKYLMSEDAGGSKIGVVSIVGMGGLGKTTLAKLLYNDLDVQEKFDLKAWAYISKDFDVCRVTKTILESVTYKSIDTDNLNIFQEKLKESLSHKRFLIVLDDIWDGSYVDWNNLMDIFRAGEMGSKIIITTRDKSVAKAMQTYLPIYRLTPLPSDDCWSLLSKHAFGANNCSKQSNLELIGKEISKQCDGLPLAAVALGGLLRTNLSENYWNKVLKSNVWDLPNVKVLPALLLSYHYLPAPLKRCFTYLSIFPKNYRLEKDMVVRLWIAEGLVCQSKSDKTIEEIGDEYFDELVSRSLIHRGSRSGQAIFEMHDLINDLATMISSSYCLRSEEPISHASFESVRHFSYNKGFNKFDFPYGSKGLRTFIALSNLYDLHLSNKVVHDFLPVMKQLRVLSWSRHAHITELPDSLGNLIYLRYLDLSRTKIQKLPDATYKLYNMQTLLLSNCRLLTKLPEDIGNLIYLRYLDLSYTKIQRLPDATCKLYNMQTLLLSYCQLLTELPEDIGNLVNLQHLNIRGTNLKKMPIQIATLQNLHTLSDFVISKTPDGLTVRELKNFSRLRGQLSILKLQNVTDPSEAAQANLKKKDQIDSLALEWDCGMTENTQIERLVLEQLQPPINLKELSIRFYGGSSFPNWLGDSSFGNMVSLCIMHCYYCWSLPPLGRLVSLKRLYICGMKSVKTVGTEFYGSNSTSFQPFPSLETLSFRRMPEWEEWNLIGGTTIEFPRLSKLFLNDCPKLKGTLPNNLPSISFELSDCPLLVPMVCPQLRENLSTNSLSSIFLESTNCMVDLTISNITSPASLRDGLPTTLQSLTLHDCEKLEFLPHDSLHNYTSLKNLEMHRSCYSLTSFTLGCLPVLENLEISGCKNLKSISFAENASQSLSLLRHLVIEDCPELDSLPEGGLPTPNLIDLMVSNCGKLKSLQLQINTLNSLQRLIINGLPNLESFAKDGLPIKLRQLEVGRLGGSFLTTIIRDWGLQRLTCLSKLYIEGEVLNVLMKMKMSLLPTSLVRLEIYNLCDIKSLDGKWLQHLTSLKELHIENAQQLESLPEEGLPSSLSKFTIWTCPLLEASCVKGEKEWPKISHIPYITINGETNT